MSPTVLDTSLADYEAARNELILQDRSLRADHNRSLNLSEAEIAADSFVRSIRQSEEASVWSAEYHDITHPFPGMEFLTGRRIITQTKLFQILSKMPKGSLDLCHRCNESSRTEFFSGGLLHVHLDATVDAKFLLKQGLSYPCMHIRAPKPFNASNISTMFPEFCARREEDWSSDTSGLTDPAYSAGTWIPLQTARNTFDPALGGPDGFDRWVLGAMTINPAEAYGTHNTVPKVAN